MDGWCWGGKRERGRSAYFFESTGVKPTRRSKFHVGMEMQSGIYEVGGRHRHVVEGVLPRSVL